VVALNCCYACSGGVRTQVSQKLPCARTNASRFSGLSSSMHATCTAQTITVTHTFTRQKNNRFKRRLSWVM
jgi:hypothetical protein